MKRFILGVFVFTLAIGFCFSASAANRLRVSGDNTWVAFVNGEKVGEGSDWQAVGVYEFNLMNGGGVIAIYIHDAEPGAAGVGGALADIALDNGSYYGSDNTWKADAGDPIAQRNDGWEMVDFDDSGWENAHQMDQFGAGVWGGGTAAMKNNGLSDPDCTAYWVWAGPNDGADEVYLRFTIPGTIVTAVKSSGKLATSWGSLKK